MRTATALGTILVLSSAPLHAEVELEGDAQLRQVISTNTASNTDATGWLEAGLGGTARVTSRRLNGTANARVARRFEQFGDINRNYRVDAFADMVGQVIEERVFLTVGGSARQYERDVRGFVGFDPDADTGNRVQTYAGYVEPAWQQPLTSDFDFDARYRLGVTTVDGIDGDARLLNSNIGLDGRAAGARGLTDSFSQSANASIGSTPGRHKLGLRALGSWTHEKIDELNQRYTAYSGSLQATYQVSRKLSLTFQGGYEDILNTQDSILFDPVTGLPVVGEDGEFVIDPTNPRRVAFDRSGLFGTAGFRYAPNRRTEINFEGGYRYGDPNFNAFVRYQLGSRTNITGIFTQGLSSFGRGLTQRSNFGAPVGTPQPPSNCIGGFDPITGACLGGFGQSIQPGTFRSRRGELSADRSDGRLNLNGSLFYESRSYFDLQQLQVADQPDVTDQGFDGDDTNYGIRVGAGYNLSDVRKISGNLAYTRYEYALSRGRTDDLIIGSVSYSQELGQSLSLIARGGATFRLSSGGFGQNNSNYNASVGVNYRF